MVFIDLTQDIPTAIEDGKEIAKIDNTNINDIKVILTDKEEIYIQRFFIDSDLEDIVERTIMMRKFGIKSL